MRRREPRLVPRAEVSEIAIAANLRPEPGKTALVKRAEVDYITDPHCASVDEWIKAWVQRWPTTTATFWRRHARRRSWDLRRQEAWQAYEGQAIERFVEAELEARSHELVQLREVRADLLEEIRAKAAKAKSFEGLVRSLVDLDKHITEKRSETVGKISSQVLGRAVDADGVARGGAIIDAGDIPFASEDDAHALVRALLVGGKDGENTEKG